MPLVYIDMGENMPITLSQTTRADSFSDYIALSAYQANTLESRAAIASGRGSNTKLNTWFVPMPQQLSRITTHNYTAVETSFAYSLQKLALPSGARNTGMELIDDGIQKLIGMAKGGLAGQGSDTKGDLIAMGTGIAANASMKLASSALGAVDMLKSQASMATDQPAIGMSNQELFYAGSVERNYTLAYDFVAKSHTDIYGSTGVLSMIAQLEAYSFPRSYEDNISNRDLIATPPIWRMDHAVVNSSGGVSIVAQSAPLAYLGQPKLLVLYNITAVHDTTSVVLDNQGLTYPLRTQLTLSFKEMEPVVRVDIGGQQADATYGQITAPKLMCRSEIYALAGEDEG
tara:strand:- start:1218 stop:2249 length:1032 start_codon:yes stop_codon:yes gene_type:complete